MKKIHALPAALLTALALGGAAHAQDSLSPQGSGTPDQGSMSNDTNGSTTMPAEVVPGSVGASGTSSSAPSDTRSSAPPAYEQNEHIPTRDEVKAEAASMARAGLIPHGELSTPFQDRGAQLGTLP